MNGNSQQPQGPMDMNTPVMIVLPFGAWTTMINILAKNPWEQVNGMIVVMQQQLQRAQEQRQQAPTHPTPPIGRPAPADRD